MKHTKFFILALVAAMTFSACGTDDSLEITKTDQGNGSNNGGENTGGGSGGSTGGESTDKYNTNKNVATVNMPEVVRNAIGGLEFPKLKNNGTSYPIVHIDKTTGMLNYSTEWDDNMKSQRWSCYTFNTTNTKQNIKGRYEAPYGQRQYPWDIDLQEQWNIVDFTDDPTPTSQHMDHGHICPNADRLYNANQRYQTYYMTNMQPQYRDFNQHGTWYEMEKDLRTKAPKIDSDTLFIVKGGTIDPVGSKSNLLGWKKNGASSETQKSGYIPIPKYFFVAVLKKELTKSTNQYTWSAFGYWFPHENKAFENGDKLGNYVVNIKTLEDKTDIDFFCNLPDEIEKNVENQDAEVLKKLWGFK